MANQLNDTRKEFTQKYRLDEYSRAVPSKVFQGKHVNARLGDYCEPVDSAVNSKSDGKTASRDSTYALPEDSLSNCAEDRDVYELAQQTVGDYDVPPPPVTSQMSGRKTSPKPSPKPRGSQSKKQTSVDSAGLASKDKDKVGRQHSYHETGYSKASDFSHSEGLSGSHHDRRRPSKKVVEIEYEVASAIRPSQTVASSGGNVNQAQPPMPTQEDLYEEPWDLKVKRLKQEEEDKKQKKLSMVIPEHSMAPPAEQTGKLPLYEEAWDSMAQQKKLEKKLDIARSVSQTSEADIFHDAVDSGVASPSMNEGRGASGPVAAQSPMALPAYEDAWDLKTSIINKQMRQMQLQEPPATYEDPWDSSRQQQKLQSKLERSGAVAMPSKENLRNRSNSDVHGHAHEMDQTINAFVRGKHHSMDESKTKLKSKGCNIGQRINPIIPLANQNWYHANISRDDAEKMLCVCKEGSYIVRISSDRKSYSLSIKSAKQYIHVQIEQVLCDDGAIHYILGKNSKEFCTIPEMIDYYTHHRVPLRGAEHITLLHPVECKWS